MALICINGLRECDGCGRCRSRIRCSVCREEIISNEDRLAFGDTAVCADCLSSTGKNTAFAADKFKHHCIRAENKLYSFTKSAKNKNI